MGLSQDFQYHFTNQAIIWRGNFNTGLVPPKRRLCCWCKEVALFCHLRLSLGLDSVAAKSEDYIKRNIESTSKLFCVFLALVCIQKNGLLQPSKVLDPWHGIRGDLLYSYSFQKSLVKIANVATGAVLSFLISGLELKREWLN